VLTIASDYDSGGRFTEITLLGKYTVSPLPIRHLGRVRACVRLTDRIGYLGTM